MTDAVITTLIVGIGTGANILIQLYRENRNRTWDQQDRDRRAAEAALLLKNETEGIASRVADRAAEVVRISERRADTRQQRNEQGQRQLADALAVNTEVTQANATQLLDAVAANTEVTQEAVVQAKAAYSEANTVNKKIASIGLEMKDGKPLNEGSNQ